MSCKVGNALAKGSGGTRDVTPTQQSRDPHKRGVGNAAVGFAVTRLV